MSADTEEQREADLRDEEDAIMRVLLENVRFVHVREALALAKKIRAAEPDRCDFDCDRCRE